MLILSRQINETIRIGDNITIVVTDVYRHPETNYWQVRIGIEAPRSIHIVRGELPDVLEKHKPKDD